MQETEIELNNYKVFSASKASMVPKVSSPISNDDLQ